MPLTFREPQFFFFSTPSLAIYNLPPVYFRLDQRTSEYAQVVEGPSGATYTQPGSAATSAPNSHVHLPELSIAKMNDLTIKKPI